MKFFNRKAANKAVIGSLLTRGDAARDAGDWSAAAKAYKEALDLRPELTDIWIQHGHALKEAGRSEDAVAAYRQALTQRPDDAETHVHLAHLLKRMKQYGDAIAVFEKAADLKPDDASLHDEIAELKRAVDQFSAPSPELGTHSVDAAKTDAPGDRAAGASEPQARDDERLKSLQARLRKAQALYEDAHGENELFREQIAGQQAELEAQQAQLVEQASDIRGLKDQIRDLKTSRDELFQERNAAREEASALTSSKAMLAEAMAERDVAEKKMAELKGEMDGREKSAAARLAAAQALYEDAQSENELFKEQIAGQHAALEAQQDKVSELTAQLADVKAEREGLFQERNAARAEVETLTSRVAEIEAARDEAQTRVEGLIPLEAEMPKVKAEREGLFQERNAARAEVETLTSQVAEIEAARDQALIEAETARKTAHDYKIRVGKAREEFLRSEGQITLIKDLVLREGGL